MERKVKHDIIKMLIPIIGTWWLLKRILPDLDDITWWDYSKYSIPLTFGLVIYQAISWIGYKVFYMMYFFDYKLVEVFTKW
jgi:hypothetical protein